MENDDDSRLSKREIVEKFHDNLTDNNHSDFLIQLDDFLFVMLNNWNILKW